MTVQVSEDIKNNVRRKQALWGCQRSSQSWTCHTTGNPWERHNTEKKKRTSFKIVFVNFMFYVSCSPPPLYISIVWHNLYNKQTKEVSFIKSNFFCFLPEVRMHQCHSYVSLCLYTNPTPPFVEFLCIYPTLYFVVSVQVCCLVNLVWIQCLIKQSCTNQWRVHRSYKVAPRPPP